MAFRLVCLGILAKNMPKHLAGYYLLNSYHLSQKTKFLKRRAGEPQLSDNITLIYISDIRITAVFTVVAIIAQNKILPRFQCNCSGSKSRIRDLRKLSGLLILFAVNQDLSVRNLYRLSRKSDYTPDMKCRIITGICSENDQISSFR